MSMKATKDEHAQHMGADKKLAEDLKKVISIVETALIEQSRLTVNVAGVYVHDNHWKWR